MTKHLKTLEGRSTVSVSKVPRHGLTPSAPTPTPSVVAQPATSAAPDAQAGPVPGHLFWWERIGCMSSMMWTDRWCLQSAEDTPYQHEWCFLAIVCGTSRTCTQPLCKSGPHWKLSTKQVAAEQAGAFQGWSHMSLKELHSTLFPQIAGSYRGSYFSKVGLLITEIAAAPSLPSSFVSLHLSPCMLITEIAAAPSLPSSFVSLHMSPCMLISKISLLHLSPFICLPAWSTYQLELGPPHSPPCCRALGLLGVQLACGSLAPWRCCGSTATALGTSLWHSSGAADSGAAELPEHPGLPDLHSAARDKPWPESCWSWVPNPRGVGMIWWLSVLVSILVSYPRCEGGSAAWSWSGPAMHEVFDSLAGKTPGYGPHLKKRSYKRALKCAALHGGTWYRNNWITSPTYILPEMPKLKSPPTLHRTSSRPGLKLLSWNAWYLSQELWRELQNYVTMHGFDVVFIQSTVRTHSLYSHLLRCLCMICGQWIFTQRDHQRHLRDHHPTIRVPLQEYKAMLADLEHTPCRWCNAWEVEHHDCLVLWQSLMVRDLADSDPPFDLMLDGAMAAHLRSRNLRSRHAPSPVEPAMTDELAAPPAPVTPEDNARTEDSPPHPAGNGCSIGYSGLLDTCRCLPMDQIETGSHLQSWWGMGRWNNDLWHRGCP